MLGSATTFFREARLSRPLAVLFLAVVTLSVVPSYGQTNIFNCTSWNSGSGSCGASFSNSTLGANNFGLLGSTASVNGSNQVQLNSSGASHTANALNYATPVNVQAFTTTFTFIPGGDVKAFVLQNVTNQPGYQGVKFVAGAGCEGGF